jgi:hypothetical protein
MLRLLSDALRAGPGTPEWRAALEELRDRPRGTADDQEEYQLLLRARENLASGRSYREVRAGPAFSRKVLDEIERESAGARHSWIPSATWIAALSAVTILVVLTIVAVVIVPRGGQPPASGSPDLSKLYFVKTREFVDLDQMPSGWRKFGSLNLQADRGLRPAGDSTGSGGGASRTQPTFVGGGIVREAAIAPDQPTAFEATVDSPRPSSNVIVQLFVTDEPTFDGVSATSPHELVWLLRDDQMSVVLPGGRVEAQAPRPPAAHSLEIRVAFDREQAYVHCDGQQIWSGRHGLDPARPRSIGVRFLARAAGDPLKPGVLSLRVLEPEENKAQQPQERK